MEMIYESIEDLPIWNWNKLHEKADFTYLRRNRINGQVSKEEHGRLKVAWEKIFKEYIEHFGFSEDFLRIHRKKKEIAYLKWEVIETGDLSRSAIIETAEKELAQMGDKKNGDFWQSKASMEEVLKFQIDVRKTTVIEFYSYVKNINTKHSGAVGTNKTQ